MEAAEESRDAVELEMQGLSSGKAIAGVAVPAILLNAAPPITVAVQTALLGKYASTVALAAFAAVSTCVGFIARVFNFLVDGVSSKVGRSCGQRDWRSLATHVQLSMRWSALLGIAAVPLLLGLRRPLCDGLLALSEEVQAAAAPYWVLRTWLIPLQLLNMSAAGILQGFSRVRVNAVLSSSAAVLEMLGSALVLLWHQRQGQAGSVGGNSSNSSNLVALGCVTCGCQALLAVASLACIVALPPSEARGQVRLLQEVFGLGLGGAHHTADLQRGEALLDGSNEEDSEAGGAALEGLELAPSSPRDAHLHRRQQEEQHQRPQQPGSAPRVARTGRPTRQLFDSATREFLRDGANMFVRSMTLQLTFFLALAAATRLGTAAVAAHSIVGQLWIVTSYAVDGFAVAGIVLGSRLFAHARNPQWRSAAKRHMGRLINRVLLAGALSGLAAGLAFYLASSSIIAAFSSDPEVVAVLQHGAWVVMALAQPLNGLLFVFDGLMYATQNFRFVRNNMVSGFVIVFCPLLALEAYLAPSVAAIWVVKASLNVWRLAGGVYLTYWLFMPQFGEDKASAGAATTGGTDDSSPANAS